MGTQGLALQFAVWTDIEGHCRRLGAWATGMVPLSLQKGRINAGHLELRQQGPPLAVVDLRNGVQLCHPPRGSSLRIGVGISGSMEGVDTHAGAHDMVWVRIEAAWRLGDH